MFANGLQLAEVWVFEILQPNSLLIQNSKKKLKTCTFAHILAS